MNYYKESYLKLAQTITINSIYIWGSEVFNMTLFDVCTNFTCEALAIAIVVWQYLKATSQPCCMS